MTPFPQTGATVVVVVVVSHVARAGWVVSPEKTALAKRAQTNPERSRDGPPMVSAMLLLYHEGRLEGQLLSASVKDRQNSRGPRRRAFELARRPLTLDGDGREASHARRRGRGGDPHGVVRRPRLPRLDADRGRDRRGRP